MAVPNKGIVLSSGERQLLEELAREAGYRPEPVVELVEKLVNAEQAVLGMGRRHGIFERIRAFLEEAYPAATEGTNLEGKE